MNQIIHLEQGWQDEIKAKAIDPLETMLNEGLEKKTGRLFDNTDYVQTYT
jgi:cullin 1